MESDRLQALRDTIQDAHRLIQKAADTHGFDVIGATVVGLLLADGQRRVGFVSRLVTQ